MCFVAFTRASPARQQLSEFLSPLAGAMIAKRYQIRHLRDVWMVVRCFWIDSEKRQQYQAGRHEVPQTIPFHGKRKKNKISLFIACYILHALRQVGEVTTHVIGGMARRCIVRRSAVRPGMLYLKLSELFVAVPHLILHVLKSNSHQEAPKVGVVAVRRSHNVTRAPRVSADQHSSSW